MTERKIIMNIKKMGLLALTILALAACQQPTTTVNKTVTETKITSADADQTISLSLEEAASLALKEAGTTKEAVSNLIMVEDRENGKLVYEIDFDFKGKEYSYTIDATTGAFLEKETEKADPVTATKEQLEKAKELALTDAGLTEQEVSNLTVTEDVELIGTVYDVDFTYNQIEYSYTVDLTTNSILEKEQDKAFD